MSQQQTATRGDELQKLRGEALDGTSVALEVPKRGLPEFALGNQGIVIQTLNDAWTFANIVFRSGLAPESLKSPAQVLIALQLGMEVGLPPMASIQNVAVINGRPSLWGDVMLGLVRKSGLFDESAFDETFEYDKEGPDRRATKAICTVRRLPNGKPIIKEFSWQDVLQAKLNAKDTYQKYPAVMMMNRARAFALRAGFADILKGVISAEEARDLPPSEKNVTDTASVQRPTNLDELTEQLAGEAPSLQSVISPNGPEREETEVGQLDSRVHGDQGNRETAPVWLERETAPITEDPMAAIKAQLEECRTVPDVTRVKNSFVGPASKLGDQERADIIAICDSRAAAIRAERKSGQQALPTN